MKVFNLLFCFLFLLFAGLQYNDPDPYIWIPIYLLVAIFCWQGFRKKFYPKLFLTVAILYSMYACYLFFKTDGMLDWMNDHQAENIANEMQAKKPWIEATREFFGLVILIVVLLVNYFYSRRRAFVSANQ